jgi:MFS transporter, SHS family, lactate transporter
VNLISVWRMLSRDQRNAFVASFFGWALDAFDYFVLVFVIADVVKAFHTTKTDVAFALTLTLAMRPVGALIFGLAGDRYGRRIPLIVNVIVYSALELITGFSPALSVFLVCRALFGIGMGGEWGLGASLALESVPAEARGALSGLLQEGYPVGYLLATLVYWLAYPHVGWRGMFFIGAAPALLSIFIYLKVKESPVWLERRRQLDAAIAAHSAPPDGGVASALKANVGLFFYLVALMAAFNFMSHGTQDLYPTFMQSQRHFSHDTVSLIAVIYNVGAIIGGMTFGSLSERIGRRKAIVTAALFALPIVPLWAFSPTAALLALGAFLMQVMAQGAWGVIPAHLSELSPPALRGTFTGFAYQCGNLIASINAPLQTVLAARYFGGEDTGLGAAMACVVGVTVVAVAVITALGREKRGSNLAG